MSAFWCALLGYEVVPHLTASVRTADPTGVELTLLFTPTGRTQRGKNALHFDLRPSNRDAEVERALLLGATLCDTGQSGDEGWVVMADPEGNEFCILQSLEESPVGD